MDTRIITNNTIYLFFVIIGILISFSSCARQSNLPSTNEKLIVEDNFKLLFLCRCIEFGYNSNESIKKTLKYDLCYSGDLQNIERRKAIDSLAKLVQMSIMEDSISRSKMDAPDYLKNKKRVFQICAEYYKSEVLDSIARIK